MFSVIRLMLSQADRSRGPFGVKEITLAKLYTKTLCLPIEGADAQRLLNYRLVHNMLCSPQVKSGNTLMLILSHV